MKINLNLRARYCIITYLCSIIIERILLFYYVSNSSSKVL